MTPARLYLLRLLANRGTATSEQLHWDSWTLSRVRLGGLVFTERVCDRMRPLVAAGLVERDGKPIVWSITDAGRKAAAYACGDHTPMPEDPAAAAYHRTMVLGDKLRPVACGECGADALWVPK